MTKKQFDEFFRQRLHPLESQVPDRLFEGVMQRRRKRRLLVLWTYGTAAIVLGLCLLTAAGYWTLVRTPQSATQPQTTILAQQPTVVKDMPVLADSKENVIKNQENINNFSKKEKNTSKSSNFSKKTIKNDQNNTFSSLNNNQTTPNASIVSEHNDNININTLAPNVSSEKTVLIEQSPVTTTVTESTKSTTVLPEIKTESNETTTTIKKTNDGVGEKAKVTFSPLASKNTLVYDVAHDWYKLTGPECFVFGKVAQGRAFYLEYYGAINGNQRTLKSRSIDSNNQYLDQRNNSETSMYGLGIGAKAVLLVNNRLSIKAGLSYNEILERFEYVDKEYENIIRDPLTGGIISVEKGTSSQKTYNRYHLLDLPFLVGYELHGPKIGIGIDAGAAFNLGAWQKGDIFNSEGKIASFGKPDTKNAIISPFQSIVGVSLLGDVTLYYRLDKRSQFFVQPHVRYYLNSFTKTSYPLEQRYLTGGIQVGVRKQF